MLGCAATDAGRLAQTSPEGPPSTAQEQRPAQSEPPPVDPAEDPPPGRDAQEEEIITLADRQFERGIEALQAGDTALASELFDAALETYLSSNLLEGGSQRLHDSLNRLIDEVADLELDLVPDEPPDAVPSPVEELENITADISPGEAEKDLESIGAAGQAITFDIPMVINDQVLGWIEIFKNNKAFRNSFVGGFQRKGWYEEMIHAILSEEGLPSDLIYMAFLESTYKTSAYSRARAKGIWQFIAATGRRYGLRIDRYVDERSHPEKATRAAAAYMKDLHAEFGDWHLAMAAYNTGAGNVRMAQRRSGKKDFWDLAKTRYLRRETRNFVPAILALALMDKEPAKHGFEELAHNHTLRYDRVTVDGPTMLSLVARLAGISEEDLKFLNPHLRLGVTPPGEGEYELLVPSGHGELFMTAYYAMPESERRAQVAKVHTVREGETLARIARKYGTSVRDLTAANRIRNPHRIRAGMELTVPTFPGGGSAEPDGGVSRSDRYHIVRRGDTLSRIAGAYGVPISTILALNGIAKDTVIRPGMTLYLRHETTARAAAAPSDGTHRVARGETLAVIARQYGTTVRELCEINGIGNPNQIRVGALLSLHGSAAASPSVAESARAVKYRIRNGDNLFRIARRFQTSVEEIKTWNNIPGDEIRAGDILTIYAD